MGKRQHQKDKMYLTTTEWSTLYGGYKASSHSGKQADFRRLPLLSCCLSLVPFTHPYCDSHGNIFDLEPLLPFLQKFKVNPVTGKPLADKNLIKLNFHKANTGEYHCPVLFKPFTNSTHVVAVKTTGNVFSYDAVEQLNVKVNNLRDLINDEIFQKSDIITLQDPANLSKFNVSTFHHVKNNLRVQDEEVVKARSDATFRLKNISHDAQMILNEYDKTVKDETVQQDEKIKADKFNAAHYSTGAVAASFTSTSMDLETVHEAAVLADDIVRYSRVKKKGYVSIQTNMGTLNLELYCDTVPKACENFIRLCEKNYYNRTIFHRSIRHFMIQGGDPTGTGEGGQSYWGEPFKDLFRPNLTHKGRGVLSMANAGPNTNKSSFFITFRSCLNLDGKHTIFGRVVGGMTTLSAMEAVLTDGKDRPLEDIIFEKANIFVDPFGEVDAQLAEERKIEAEKKKDLEDELKSRKKPKVDDKKRVYRDGVGKYLDLAKNSVKKDDMEKGEPPKKKSKGTYSMKDFSIF